MYSAVRYVNFFIIKSCFEWTRSMKLKNDLVRKLTDPRGYI